MTASVHTNWHRTWNGERNDEGHRTFYMEHLVEVTDPKNDGPLTVMNCPGLPAIGAVFNFGNDTDLWAFCWPTRKVTPFEQKSGEIVQYWLATSMFSTKPIPSKRCQDTSIEDPLLEPMKISGSFVKTTEEAVYDRYGNLLKNSAHERFKGPLVEFDVSRPTVRIEQNVASLELDTVASMVDCVNDATLWGLPARCIKLSAPEFTRELYGVCNFYYKRIFNFDIRYDTFDRFVPDIGTKVLNGHWSTDRSGRWVLDNINGAAPNPNNPQHFNRYKDRNGENSIVVLNGAGLPADSYVGTGTDTSPTGPGYVYSVEKYNEANFLLLNIPTSL